MEEIPSVFLVPWEYVIYGEVVSNFICPDIDQLENEI
jgi:hypothetical protein